MDPIQQEFLARDHIAALEAEAGIERLLRDLRDLREAEAARTPRGRRVRTIVGRVLIGLGNAIAE